MTFTPQEIKDRIKEIGISEAKNLLKNWILESNEENHRRKALEIIDSLDEGNDFGFFEQLFLSDEDLEIRLISGNILREKYQDHKKIELLLEFTLTRILFLEQKLFAVEFLSDLDTVFSRKILLKFLNETIDQKFTTKKEEFPSEIFACDYTQKIPELLLIVCYNLILFDYYLKNCGYHATIRDGFIISLTADGADLKSIKNVKGFQHLKRLEYLSLKRNLIEKIEGLDPLDRLRHLDLSANYITKIENLSNLKELKLLNLSYNRIKEIENLGSLSCLEDLNLSRNEISEIKNLENLYSLRTLTLSFNNISKIQGLYELVNLVLLHLNDNLITQIKGLDRLTQLKTLTLTNNRIEKIENLDRLVKLTKLELSRNQIEKIEGLDNLRNLQELFLDDNSIIIFEGMENLDNLIILFLNNNKITYFTQAHYEHFKNLNFLFLRDNPLTPESVEAYKKWTRFP